MTTDATSVTSEAPRAMRFASSSRSRGRVRTPTTPMSGISARTVTQGNPCVMVASPGPYDEQARADEERADQHGQGIGAGEGGLGASDPTGCSADPRSEPVDGAVDAECVDEYARPRAV